MMNDVILQRSLLEELIKVAAIGARGVSISCLKKQDDVILRLAAEHDLLQLLACAAITNPAQLFSNNTESQLLSILRESASKNLVRNQRLLHLIAEMEAAGFSVQVLKGCSVSRLYSYPESRVSVDNDLLISPAQEDAVYCFLQERGFLIKGRSKTANDSICEHKKYGKIEIHIGLYPEITEKVWAEALDGDAFIAEKAAHVDTSNGSFNTLGHTDQLLFLSLHMAKHFVESGLTIRMILDVALHYAKYRNELDTERYWRIMRCLHLDQFINSTLGLLIRTNVFDRTDFPGSTIATDSQCDAIVDDIAYGGYMGVKELNERREACMEYHRQKILKSRSNFQYTTYMVGWKIRSGLISMFPNYSKLRRMFPVIEKYPVMAPIMWAYQAVAFPVKKMKMGVLQRDIRGNTSKMNETSSQRIQLFRKLNML